MIAVLLTIHFLICAALVSTVLLQRSEGGALGIGGGPGSMMSGRGAASALSRSTYILGFLFFASSVLLTIVPNIGKSGDSLVIGAPITDTLTSLPESLPESSPEALPEALNSTPADATQPAVQKPAAQQPASEPAPEPEEE